jgi:hypothetical protein
MDDNIKHYEHVVNSFTPTKKETQWIRKKHKKENFNVPWTITRIWEIKDRFHENFVDSLKAHPLLYIGVNLDVGLEN